MFQRNVASIFRAGERVKKETSVRQDAGLLLGLFFDLEDGCDIILRNVG
jgi:hypothetical protein